jgi:hypothetical protein
VDGLEDANVQESGRSVLPLRDLPLSYPAGLLPALLTAVASRSGARHIRRPASIPYTTLG